MSTESKGAGLFEREFGPADHHVFASLAEGMIGLPLVRWRETYGEGTILEFGQLVPRQSRSDRLPEDRGEWVVSDWGGDPVLRVTAAEVIDSRKDGSPALQARLGEMTGDVVAHIRMLEPDLSLEIEFKTGRVFTIAASKEDPELDQWYVLAPDGHSLGVTGDGKWYRRSG